MDARSCEFKDQPLARFGSGLGLVFAFVIVIFLLTAPDFRGPKPLFFIFLAFPAAMFILRLRSRLTISHSQVTVRNFRSKEIDRGEIIAATLASDAGAKVLSLELSNGDSVKCWAIQRSSFYVTSTMATFEKRVEEVVAALEVPWKEPN